MGDSYSQTVMILLDNTVLSNFALVNRTSLVLLLWTDAVATTTDAWREYLLGVSRGYLPGEAWETVSRIEPVLGELEIAQRMANSLGAGERSCIAVAKNRGGLFVTDDRKARQVALEMGVQVTGTIGILAAVVKRGYVPLDEANKVLQQMMEHGYRSPIQNLIDVFRT